MTERLDLAQQRAAEALEAVRPEAERVLDERRQTAQHAREELRAKSPEWRARSDQLRDGNETRPLRANDIAAEISPAYAKARAEFYDLRQEGKEADQTEAYATERVQGYTALASQRHDQLGVVARWSHDNSVWRDKQIVRYENAAKRAKAVEERAGARSQEIEEKALPAAQDRMWSEMSKIRGQAQKELLSRRAGAEQGRDTVKERQAEHAREREAERVRERQAERQGRSYGIGR